jgi:predicted TIM-barrel fold metal-dependent hydrolase
MRLDGHIHTGLSSDYRGSDETVKNKLLKNLHAAGFDGGVILSADPIKCASMDPEKRMQDTLGLCRGEETLFPYYWINPLESDALDQVQLASDLGFDGFKMICSRYDPGCPESMKVLEKIASLNKPVLFHSGICWDGFNSANHNRPGNFEALIEIPRLRFALAHVSWPWCDECIAVYGKFLNAHFARPDLSCEMFIDLTPGTPRGYREEVFRHMVASEYEYRYNLIFGTDSFTSSYNVAWAREWQERDDALYDKLVREDAEDFKDHVYRLNLLRFLGKSDEDPAVRIPMVADNEGDV